MLARACLFYMFTNTLYRLGRLGCYPWKQLYLIAFVDLVPAGSRKGQSYPVEYYLESVEEYSEGKIHKSKPEPGRIFSTKSDENTLVLLNLWVLRKLAPSRNVVCTLQSGRIAWTLSLKYLSVKPRLLMKKCWFLATDRDWKSDRTSFKVLLV